MDDTVRVRCPYCREWIDFYVDPDSVGQLVEDCAVCCQPWAVTIERTAGKLRGIIGVPSLVAGLRRRVGVVGVHKED